MRKGEIAGLADVRRAGVPREAPGAGDAASNQIRQHHRYSDSEHEPKRHAEEAVECPPRGRVRERGGLPRESTHGQSCDHDGSRDTDEDVGQENQAVSNGIPWPSLMSRRGHVPSIGSSAVVLAPSLRKTAGWSATSSASTRRAEPSPPGSYGQGARRRSDLAPAEGPSAAPAVHRPGVAAHRIGLRCVAPGLQREMRSTE
jgi:hypothetical protein